MGREAERTKALDSGLVITVHAKANRGKTTIARLIEEMLRQEGFSDVVVADDPRDSTPGKAPIQERVEATKKRPVFIETQQLRAREPRTIIPGEVPMAED